MEAYTNFTRSKVCTTFNPLQVLGTATNLERVDGSDGGLKSQSVPQVGILELWLALAKIKQDTEKSDPPPHKCIGIAQ